jgi:hypothetical protein
MATTTAAAIRNRAIVVIKAIAPTSDTQLRFIPWDNPAGADFREAMRAYPSGSTRQFQVRWTGRDVGTEVTNEDYKEQIVELEVVVAYAADHRFGAANALDRDRAMDEDRHAIEAVIGVTGSANFTAATGADACWREATNLDQLIERYPKDGIDFLVIKQAMSFFRAA